MASGGDGAFSPTDIDGLVAWYPLTADANDYSGNDYHGIASGGVSFGSSGATFDGIDGVVTLPTAICNLASLTGGSIFATVTATAPILAVAGWCTADPLSNSYFHYLSVGGSTVASATETLGFNVKTADPASNTQLQFPEETEGSDKYLDGSPHDVVLIVDGASGNATFNVDNDEKTTTISSKTAGDFLYHPTTGVGLALSSRMIYSNGTLIEAYYAGTLKNVCIFSGQLTAQDIANLNSMV